MGSVHRGLRRAEPRADGSGCASAGSYVEREDVRPPPTSRQLRLCRDVSPSASRGRDLYRRNARRIWPDFGLTQASANSY